jgi:hypothetical protein
MGGIPAFLVYQHIHDWFQGNLVHIDLDFNLDEVPHNDFETRLNGMLDIFEGRLQQYVNFYLNFFDTDLLHLGHL